MEYVRDAGRIRGDKAILCGFQLAEDTPITILTPRAYTSAQ